MRYSLRNRKESPHEEVSKARLSITLQGVTTDFSWDVEKVEKLRE
ncbi:MAG: hypothetical protein AAF349_17720 [Cyanobacteria bacterium P01_A01_bin.68]